MVATSLSEETLGAALELFVDVVTRLSNDVNVLKIESRKRHLEGDLPKLRRLIGDILMLGLVPGSCSVCRRLGL